MDRNEEIYLDRKHLESDLLIKQIMRMAERIDLLRSRVNDQHIHNLNKVIEVKKQRIVSLIKQLILVKKYYGLIISHGKFGENCGGVSDRYHKTVPNRADPF